MPTAGLFLAAIDEEPVPPGGHRNILVEGNTFEDIDATNMFLSSVTGMVVRNNRFVNPQHHHARVKCRPSFDAGWQTASF